MKNLTIIAAIGKNGELGNNNELLWKIPEDMLFFKENTMNKYIIMGMNTLKSLPKLLPNRKHIVLTHQNVDLNPDIVVLHNLEDLLNHVKTLDEELMVIGGGQLYSLLINYASKMLLTEIDDEKQADVYFPNFDKELWKKQILSEHEYMGIHYKHVVYIKK